MSAHRFFGTVAVYRGALVVRRDESRRGIDAKNQHRRFHHPASMSASVPRDAKIGVRACRNF
jgi:hypothetical protein